MSDESLARVAHYYDRFSRVYDVLSSPRYYRKPREAAVEALRLEPGQVVLNVPCGTGQSFQLLQDRLRGTGTVVGVDLSPGMLAKADAKVRANGWKNVDLIRDDVAVLDAEWAASRGVTEGMTPFCAISVSPASRPGNGSPTSWWPPSSPADVWWSGLVHPHRSLRGAFIRWIGKGEVDRDLPSYLRDRLDDVEVDQSFKGSDMFVAAGVRRGGSLSTRQRPVRPGGMRFKCPVRFSCSRLSGRRVAAEGRTFDRVTVIKVRRLALR